MEKKERGEAVVNWLIYNRYATSRGDLARRIGYNATVLSAALTGRNVFSDRLARRLCEFNKQLNLEWLQTGKGEMLLPEAKAAAPTNEAPMTPPRRGRAPGQRNAVTRRGREIPFYRQLNVSAGQVDMFGYNDTHEYICIPTIDADAYFPVSGMSMAPYITPGDIIGVKEVNNFERIDPDRIYMIITRGNERMIKHIAPSKPEDEFITLTSDNQNYAPFTIPKADILKVMQVVAVTREI